MESIWKLVTVLQINRLKSKSANLEIEQKCIMECIL